MKRVAGAIMAHNSAHCIWNAVASLHPHVDGLTILIDDRTDDGTREEIQAAGVPAWTPATATEPIAWDHYTFDDATGFGGAYNNLMDRAMGRADADWVFILDADEVIDNLQAQNIRRLVEQFDRTDADCIGVPRRNWWDLKREKSREEWWPDHQWRLLKKGVRYKWRVHPSLVAGRMIKLAPDELTIHHFNLVYRPTEEAWAPVNKFYADLMALDVADGRIP